MNKIETKKLFWKIVNYVEDCCDTTVTNDKDVLTERGMQLSNGYSIMFCLDDGALKICNDKNETIAMLTEDNEILAVLKEVFENLEE